MANPDIEQVLPGSVDNGLSEKDLDAYRKPYLTSESRRPMLQWPPRDAAGRRPAEVVARIERYDEWLTESADVPKLLLTFDLGIMMTPGLIDWCVTNMANLELEKCGAAWPSHA